MASSADSSSVNSAPPSGGVCLRLEDAPDVGEQLDAQILDSLLGILERQRGLPRPLRPVTARDRGDRHQRPPVVGGAIVQLFRRLDVRRADRDLIVQHEARELAAQLA